MPHSAPRSPGSVRLALLAAVVLVSAVGYLVTKAIVDNDRETAAERRGQVQSVRIQSLLGRGRAYVTSLGAVLAGEPAPRQRRFAQLEGSTAGGLGLVDALWVEHVPGSRRASYERRLGAPILRLRRSRFEQAPPALSYLPATFTSGTRRELRRGVDVSDWPALAAAIRDQSAVFAVGASTVGSLGRRAGFYLVEAGRFGRGPGSTGVLALFVPQGWLTVSLEDDPQRLKISLDGRRLEGSLDSAPAASTGFQALSRSWRIDLAAAPPTGLQSTLPWVAAGWPLVAGLVALLLGGAILRRRRAERQVERLFEVSPDLLGTAGFDGYFKRVNPAFERVLGYSAEEILSRPYLDFVHPDDRARTSALADRIGAGESIVSFENRYVCKDGSYRWLQWTSRPIPEEGVMYGVARDVTGARRAAEEEAALRRVATLVAEGGAPTKVFDAVTKEMATLLEADGVVLLRCAADGSTTFVAGHSDSIPIPAEGTRYPLEGDNVSGQVLRTGLPAKMDTYEGALGFLAQDARERGIRSSVGAPVIADGRIWGVIVALWTQDRSFPADVQDRVARFTELVATAIGNAESRAELTASRARIVTAADETRRQIERDLHDGTQQRLLSLALALRATEERVPAELTDVREELEATAKGLSDAVEDLREISRGIHPAILSVGGLAPALRTLARRSPVPVELEVDSERRLPEHVEVAAYYVISEALTNAARHAQASVVRVDVDTADSVVELRIRDDGVGGADPGRGSGLVGLRDRVEALGGTLQITSNPGDGTLLRATVPLGTP